MKYVKPLNEATRYKDRSGKSLNIKGINFVYTDRGRFYGTSLYDVAKTANVNKRSKIGYADTEKLLKSLGIKDSFPMYYDTDELDNICKQVSKKGMVCDHGDYMDVS